MTSGLVAAVLDLIATQLHIDVGLNTNVLARARAANSRRLHSHSRDRGFALIKPAGLDQACWPLSGAGSGPVLAACLPPHARLQGAWTGFERAPHAPPQP